jgi:serine O-acetyltransferase
MAIDVHPKERLSELTDRLVSTYSELEKISHLGHDPLPNYEVVIGATENLKEVLFPGYRRRDGLHAGNVAYHAGNRT